MKKIIFSLVFFTSCLNVVKEPSLTRQEAIELSKQRDSIIVRREIDAKDRVLLIETYKNGNVWGNTVKLYKTGKVHQYKFFTDSLNYTYAKSYDDVGNSIFEIGSPAAYNLIGGSSDTIVINVVFADYIFKEFKVRYSEDGLNYDTAHLDKNVMPFKPYAVFTYTKDIRSTDRIDLYLEMETTDIMNNNRKYYDTIKLQQRKE
ncbi:hypothetical protein GFS24_06455 [Chitinophaga sp. SYP-B3965]|uniref:hypothetical protein n=1 Tax=Chitinophaga sp. SYP-B3965 TaxID=2663120 RepID=UPI001299DB47|nr:hypothetical protein [Chitinophaga sp. SYP-B3965]MRG44746.1 hypothetical protein [Chitinophaga sp. SYP-B3965]